MAVPIQVIRLGVIGVVVAGFVTFKYVTAGMVEDKIGKAMIKAGIPTKAISYDASVDLLGFSTHLNDITIKFPGRDELEIDEITIKNFDADHDIPEFMNIEIEGLEVQKVLRNLPLAKMTKGIVKDMDDAKMNFTINYQFDTEKQLLDIKEISESIDELGKISFSTELHKVKSLQMLIQSLMINPNAILIGKSEIEYKDDSLVERIMQINAAKEKISLKEYRNKILSVMNEELKKADKKENTELEKDLLSAMIDFIKNPDEFEISIDPKEPMSLREMTRGNPNENIKKMNLEID